MAASYRLKSGRGGGAGLLLVGAGLLWGAGQVGVPDYRVWEATLLCPLAGLPHPFILALL